MNGDKCSGSAESLKSLFPELGDQEFAEADDRLSRYVALAARVYERLLADPEAYEQFRALTEDSPRATMLRTGLSPVESSQLVPRP